MFNNIKNKVGYKIFLTKNSATNNEEVYMMKCTKNNIELSYQTTPLLKIPINYISTTLFLQISSHCAILEAGRDFSHFSHSLRWVMKNWTIDSSNHVHWLGNCLASTALGASRRTIRLPLGSNITLLAFRKYRTLIQKKVTLLQKRTKYMYRLVSFLCCLLLNLFAKQNKLNSHKDCFEVHSGTQ